jgi:hypothetical protein
MPHSCTCKLCFLRVCLLVLELVPVKVYHLEEHYIICSELLSYPYLPLIMLVYIVQRKYGSDQVCSLV